MHTHTKKIWLYAEVMGNIGVGNEYEGGILRAAGKILTMTMKTTGTALFLQASWQDWLKHEMKEWHTHAPPA